MAKSVALLRGDFISEVIFCLDIFALSTGSKGAQLQRQRIFSQAVKASHQGIRTKRSPDNS